MTSQDTTKTTRDKEMAAVMYNFKEQRVLEKCLQTLSLEQTYSMKLLELGNREIKVQYKKLKDKVSKIKSYLPVEDISRFRQLEMQSNLKPTYECHIQRSTIKMAEASRRLNLLNNRVNNTRSTRSSLPRIYIQKDAVKLPSSSSLGETMDKYSNCLTVVFTNDQQAKTQHNTISHSQYSSRPQSRNLSLQQEDTSETIEENLTQLPNDKQDIVRVLEEHPMFMHREKSETSFRAHSAYSHTHSPFSSHVTAGKDSRAGLRTAPVQSSNIRRFSQMSHDSIDSNLGENIFEKRRLELLEEENYQAAVLDKKTQDFLKQVDKYLHRKTPIESSNVISNNIVLESSLDKSRSFDSLSNPRQQRFHNRSQSSEWGAKPTYLPEQVYKERVLTLWKDMNKCRYLRLTDDKLDLSGINTLAKDNLKLFQAMRQTE